MQDLAPHFISVTASNNKFDIEETTVRLTEFIANDLKIPTIAHLPAVYLTKDMVSRAGRNLPDKEFRYLRTVIVTAAVYWGFD